MKKTSLTVVLVFVVLSLFAVTAYAITLDNSGNAAGSSNSINVNINDSTQNTQSNTFSGTNNVNNGANSGDNSAISGGQIITGNAESNVNITNIGNINRTSGGCCGTPTPKPGQSPAPTTPPGGGGDGDGGGVGGGGGAGGGGAAGGGGGGIGGGEIMGLSATAGNGSDRIILYAVASVCLGLGKLLLGKKQPSA